MMAASRGSPLRLIDIGVLLVLLLASKAGVEGHCAESNFFSDYLDKIMLALAGFQKEYVCSSFVYCASTKRQEANRLIQ
jgi:hypothetical protein